MSAPDFADMTAAVSAALAEARRNRASGEVVLRIGLNQGEVARAEVNVTRPVVRGVSRDTPPVTR